MSMNWIFRLSLVVVTLGSTVEMHAQPLAFPGAEGFGAHATGGRGGTVYVVENLNDEGPGSLREAVRKHGPRIIVFAVSGTIALKSSLDINNGDLTIAGQSAPGDGICLKDYPVNVKADNVILRYLRVRMGDETKQEADALGGRKQDRVMIDHCSISWSTDECASFYWNKNFTMQWCIISESLNESVHHKGDHGYGGIWGGEGATFHHNLLAHHTSRNPRFSGSSSTPNTDKELVDFRNNVIYNWGGNSIYGGEKGHYNVVNNYYKPGPATEKSKRERIIAPWEPYGQYYIHGNYMVGSEAISAHNWEGGVQADNPAAARHPEPFPAPALEDAQDAVTAYEAVLKKAGASRVRDAVDQRIVREVRDGTATFGTGIIDSQAQVGGWPELKSTDPPADQDRDGMPDRWEKKHRLDPRDSADGAQHTLNPLYTNVEVYLNELAERPL